ncbi:hypothetical protein ACFVAJ_01715 [Agromyces sp. NPDC057679]|uniref:hypothetical protein n=1 Tax=Agromyces sp. NPDC057679 TaxID=3346207 RepID=UPI0036717D47
MKQFFGRLAERAMPVTYNNLKLLARVDPTDDSLTGRMLAYELEVRELRAELNEVRGENRRVVELYDLVFERLREDMPLRATPMPTSPED